MPRSRRLSALVRAAVEAAALPPSVDRLDEATRDRLETFAKREGLSLTAALAVVRSAQSAARTELRSDARVERAVETVLDRRRRGIVGLDSPADSSASAAFNEITMRRADKRPASA
ncbi:hypothetical protein [Agromyces allii]|uniref:Ribbon-helix-helix protein CopG domain-containing protein n=1 Tax=Agromyces allii TaxID=393607 RepID=A0ABN2QE47_9MICO|nr:hypothetical protein [Agromyces allii]